MSKFGLACEGATDHIAISNILYGCFPNLEDANDEIKELQPLYSKAKQKQLSEGGWKMLLHYLQTKQFRDAVRNIDFVIVQIDTDISEREDSRILLKAPHRDTNNEELSPEQLIKNIQARLITIINEKKPDFYEKNAHKIIFAICVHSLECWFVSFYSEQPEIHNCNDILKTLPISSKIRITKKQKNYNQLSEPFLIKENIDVVAQKDPSFQVVIQALKNIQI